MNSEKKLEILMEMVKGCHHKGEGRRLKIYNDGGSWEFAMYSTHEGIVVSGPLWKTLGVTLCEAVESTVAWWVEDIEIQVEDETKVFIASQERLAWLETVTNRANRTLDELGDELGRAHPRGEGVTG